MTTTNYMTKKTDAVLAKYLVSKSDVRACPFEVDGTLIYYVRGATLSYLIGNDPDGFDLLQQIEADTQFVTWGSSASYSTLGENEPVFYITDTGLSYLAKKEAAKREVLIEPAPSVDLPF